MSYSVTASGTKEEAKRMLDAQHQKVAAYMTEAQREALKALLDSMPGSAVSLSANGHNGDLGGALSLTVHGFQAPPGAS